MQKCNKVLQISNRIILFNKSLSYLKFKTNVLPKSCNKSNFTKPKYVSEHILCYCTVTKPDVKCWNCGAERKTITAVICDKCNVIQEPYNDTNYFKVLNLEESYDVDQKLLTATYRKLQAILHPDKYTNKSEKEQSISADFSALVNKAYNTIQLPLPRAIHMLELHGEKIEENQKLTNPEFLMEIMELNEEVEEAKSPEQLKKLNEKNKGILDSIKKKLSENFSKKEIEKAKENVIKMKYYNSVSLHINGLLRERGIVD